jgi:large subunit ribosomal protein L29
LPIRCRSGADSSREDILCDKGHYVKVKVQQYREMSLDELKSTLQELSRHLFDLRSQAVTEKLENSKGINNVRRDIARIKTVMRERA